MPKKNKQTPLVNTGKKQRAKLFQPGQSGNPLGRPKGSRNKLGEAFLQDVYADWLANGATVIERMRRDDPSGYVRVVAGILPKELHFKDNTLSELSDEQLSEAVSAILAVRAGRAGNGVSKGSSPANGKAESDSVH